MARLYSYYKETVVPDLVKKFGYKTAMQVPRIEKITLNMGVGEAVADKKIMDNAVADMTKIAGQKPLVTKSQVQMLADGISLPTPEAIPLPVEMQPQIRFTEEQIKKGLPK